MYTTRRAHVRTAVALCLLAAAGCSACGVPDAVLRDAGAAFGVTAAVLCGGAEAARRCAACPVVTDLQRRLDRTGFHRLLVTHLQVQVPPQQPSSFPCQVALLERLTRDVYCDKYELARLPRAAASVHMFGDFQVERPAPECKGSVVGIVLAGQAAVLNADGRMMVNASTVLPIHARYPGPAQPGQATLQSVAIAPPVVLLRCGTDPGAAWQVASVMPQAEAQPLIWKVPAGRAGSAPFVAAVTRAVTYTAAVAVLAAMATHGRGQQRPRVKAP